MRTKHFLLVGSLLLASLAVAQVANYPFPQSIPRSSQATDFQPASAPTLDTSMFMHIRSSIVGDVEVGQQVYVAPNASLRGDIGYRVSIGDYSSIQDGVYIAARPVRAGNTLLENRAFSSSGERGKHDDKHPFAVYLSNRVFVSPMAQIEGPAWLGEGVFVGAGALISEASIGAGSVIEPGARVLGVEIPPQSVVPAGQVVNNPEIARRLPKKAPDSPWVGIHQGMIETSVQLAEGNNGRFDEIFPIELVRRWESLIKNSQQAPSVPTRDYPAVLMPSVAADAVQDPSSSMLGDVSLLSGARVQAFSVLRADQGAPIVLQEGATVAEGAVLLAIRPSTLSPASAPSSQASQPTSAASQSVPDNQTTTATSLPTVLTKTSGITLGARAQVGAQASLIGPVTLQEGAVVETRAVVMDASVGAGTVVERGAVVLFVNIPEKVRVPAGRVIARQEDAAALPPVTVPPSATSTEASEDVFAFVQEAAVEPGARLRGNLSVAKDSYVAPTAHMVAKGKHKITVSTEGYLQDGAMLLAAAGDVQLSSSVLISAQSNVQGPANFEENVVVGAQALISRATLGAGTIVAPSAQVHGVKIAPKRYVSAGQVVLRQEEADALPEVTEEQRAAYQESYFVGKSFAAVYSNPPRPAPVFAINEPVAAAASSTSTPQSSWPWGWILLGVGLLALLAYGVWENERRH